MGKKKTKTKNSFIILSNQRRESTKGRFYLRYVHYFSGLKKRGENGATSPEGGVWGWGVFKMITDLKT